MFEIFLTVIGVPVVLVLFAIESGKKEAAEKRSSAMHNQTITNMRNWISSVTDSVMENKIQTELITSEGAFNEKYFTELTNSCSEIWGSYKTNEVDNYDAMRILMANRGKLMKRDAEVGITVNEYRKQEDQDLEVSKKARLVYWINNKLKEHGVNEQVLAMACGKYYIVRDDNACGGRFAGTYVWQPTVEVAEWGRIQEFDPVKWYE